VGTKAMMTLELLARLESVPGVRDGLCLFHVGTRTEQFKEISGTRSAPR